MSEQFTADGYTFEDWQVKPPHRLTKEDKQMLDNWHPAWLKENRTPDEDKILLACIRAGYLYSEKYPDTLEEIKAAHKAPDVYGGWKMSEDGTQEIFDPQKKKWIEIYPGHPYWKDFGNYEYE